MMPTFIQVAVAVPVADYFDYTLPPAFPKPAIGARVRVSFGRRVLVGIVVGISTNSDVPPQKLKAINEIIDQEALLPAISLEFAQFLSQYYHYPLGETLAVMLPSLVRQGQPIDNQAPTWQLQDSKESLTPKQQATLATIEGLADKQLVHNTRLFTHGMSKAQLTPLINKGYLVATYGTAHATPFAVQGVAPALTDAQQSASNAIIDVMITPRYQGFLLDGVTGSGKTEVYLQAIAHALAQHKQVLVLLPEIGLTPQTKQRFAERFSSNILVLHSNLSDSARLQGFLACRDGSAQLIIATRSAIFYPFAKLGLIIIDEAHDPSYKQQDHLRYHTCDIALYLASKLAIPVVLGTATPSLEQLVLHQKGKLTRLTLSERIGGTMPHFALIDKRLGSHFHQNKDGASVSSELSPLVVHAIRTRLAKGEQVLIYLNRRGYAPIVLCEACGYQADCRRCNSHLTLHKSYHTARLKCHHCHYDIPMPTHCPACNSPNLTSLGQGTSQLYEHLHALFADPQANATPYPILQIDRDTTSKKDDWQAIYEQVLSARPMVLVGTQMLAKGHHFPNVTLVVIVDADSGFLSPDFRAPEHICQQIIQVAGRAGRAEKAGKVLIQTLQPDNPLLLSLIKDGYHATAELLLAQRALLGLPPVTYTALIQADSHEQSLAQNAIVAIKPYLATAPNLTILAPITPPLAKKNNRYFVQMLLISPERQALQHALRQVWQDTKKHLASHKVKLSLTIDPINHG